jgi:hypothetical protein
MLRSRVDHLPRFTMRHRPAVLLSAALLLSPATVFAQQHSGSSATVSSAPPREAAQLAFLVGQWEVTVMPKVSSLAAKIHGQPKLKGSWKAWRALDGFGIVDELRIMDASGNPTNFTHTVRLYDAAQRQWLQTATDVYRARVTQGTGVWANNMLVVRSEGRDADGKPVLNEARFTNVTATTFEYTSNRSSDGGRTWDTGVLRMTAKRLSATATP